MTEKPRSFEDRVAVITGAGRGLGRAYALEIAARGGRVVVNDPGAGPDGRGEEKSVADAVVHEIRGRGGEAVASYDSVADAKSAAHIVAIAKDAFGTVDIVINNAGNAHGAAFEDTSLDDIRNVIECHLMGGIAVTHAAWPIMKAKRYGRVVMTLSTAGLFGIEGVSGYAAAKGGLFGLMKCLAREGEPHEIRVNGISPGARTRLSAGMFGSKTAHTWRPELVAPAVLYLASEACTLSGVALSAMAGRYARAEMVESPGVKLDPKRDISLEEFVGHLPAVLDLTGAEALMHGFAAQITGSAAREPGVPSDRTR